MSGDDDRRPQDPIGEPAVCALPPDQLRERIDTLRRELLPQVVRAEELPGGSGIAMDFAASGAMQQQLDRLVDFERQCCSGLEWNVGPSPLPDRLRLTVAGLAPDSVFFRALGLRVDSEAGAEPDPKAGPGAVGEVGGGRLARLVKAGGLGFGAAFFLLCVLPIGLAAVVGGGLATSLLRLDDPWIIAVGSLALALPAWWWVRRRERGAGEPAARV